MSYPRMIRFCFIVLAAKLSSAATAPSARRIPEGIQTIRQLYEGRYTYIDQTGYFLQLLANGKHYFIARPERSGKSLFLNTLEEIFRGHKDIFAGTEIYNSQYHWIRHPVVMFDFSQISSRTPGHFEKGLIAEMKEIAKMNKLTIHGAAPSFQFLLKRLIQDLAAKHGTGVVVLVDEYDNPIAYRKDTKLAEKNQEVIDDFFATLKSLDRHLKFTLVTGVDRSIIHKMRGANYLKDISVDPEYQMFLEFTKDAVRL